MDYDSAKINIFRFSNFVIAEINIIGWTFFFCIAVHICNILIVTESSASTSKEQITDENKGTLSVSKGSPHQQKTYQVVTIISAVTH